MNHSRNTRSSFPSLAQRLWQQARMGDYLVATAFLALALGSFWLDNLFSQNGQTAQTARVFVRNRLITEVDLQQTDTLKIDGVLGKVTLAVAERGIRVIASSCPNQYCLKQGAIRCPQQMLVCVPNHLLAVIAGPEKTNLDGVTF